MNDAATGAGWRRPAIAVLVAGIASCLTIAHGDIGWDATFVLQVIARVQNGDVLYRDVFFGVPPLSVHAGRLATAVAGTELAVLKVLVALTLAGSWWAAARIVERTAGNRRFDLPLAVAVVATGVAEPASLYQPLAAMFLIVAIDAAASCVERPSVWSAAAAGAAAGLSVLSKHTTGTFALGAAVLVCLIATTWPRFPARAKHVLAMLMAFGACVLAGLIPIVVSGGWPQFVDYAFLNKGTYLQHNGVSFLEGAGAFLASLAPGPGWNAVAIARSMSMVVPPLFLAALVVLWRAPSLAFRHRVAATALGLASAATMFPRADVPHVTVAAPAMIATIAVAWAAARRSGAYALPRAALAAVAVVVVLFFGVRLTAMAAAVRDPDRIWSDLPHLHGLVVERARLEELRRAGTALRESARGEPLFLLMPNAGIYYLVSGVKNPTPFDYPLVTAFGRTGERDTIARIERGELSGVCFREVTAMAPAAIQDAVRKWLEPGEDLGPCRIYHRR